MTLGNKQDTKQAPRKSRRLLPVLAILALSGAGGAAYLTALTVTNYTESRLSKEVSTALRSGGFDWVSTRADGTKLHISGIAPDEVTRYRALLRAERAIQFGQVVDDMQVQSSTTAAPPDFEAQLLRNDQGISIIGLVPAGLDRASVLSGLQRGIQTGQVTDLLETADYPVPANWDEAFSFGLRTAQLAPRSKISIRPGQVTVQASTDDLAARDALIEALQRNTPENVTLITDISAPRPVIAPFALRFVSDAKGVRFDSCSANDQQASDAILAAGHEAGASETSQCQLGLGKPSEDWGQVAVTAIRAVAELEQGAVTILDGELTLSAPITVPAEKFEAVAARLDAALPEPFHLTAKRDEAPDADAPATEFSARTMGSGEVVLGGIVSDERMRDAVESFARSRFGRIEGTLQLVPELPSGWTVRMIAGLEAMADLQRGAVLVDPDLIRVSGVSGDQSAAQLAALRLAERLGPGQRYELQITYDRWLDPLLGLPSGPICVDHLNSIMRESLIGFEPNRSIIAGDPEPTLELLSQAMVECGDYRIELGGHTDSQGSDTFNAQLSQQRAQAVLTAMADYGISTGLMNARGYGESQPIADNDTDAGREANRRIEFRLLSEEPVNKLPSSPAPVVAGITMAADAQVSPAVTPQPDQPQPFAPGVMSSDQAQAELPKPSGLDEGSFVQMIATILVTELAVSPDQAIDTAEVNEGADDFAAIVHAATSVAQSVLDPDAAIHAATWAGQAAIGTGEDIMVLVPDENTPRPRPRP